MFFKRKPKNEGIFISAKKLNLFKDFFSKGTQDKFKESIGITDEYAYLLSKYGWYISAEMSWKLVYDVFQAVNHDDVKYINKRVKEYYIENLEIKQEVLVRKFPERKGIISEAF